ncbi:MAG: N-acetyl-gamma-glutamyl-phosphate reductase [Planctomycetota bacterium]
MTHRAAIVGVSGYTGQELVRLVVSHPELDLVGLFGSSTRSGEPIGDVAPGLRGVVEGEVRAGTASAIAHAGAEVAFLATPHEASVGLAGDLLDAGVRVVDLSAAFRLQEASLYPRFYGFDHARPDLLAEAVYGMPELDRSRLRGARLLASPGCYPTSAVLPIAALASAGLIDGGRRVIIDSTSGVSGAGRGANARTSFCEVSQSPYAVLTHRHQPEIDAYCGTETIFTPHLGPYARGICSTIHIQLAQGCSEDDARSALHDAYKSERFVRLLPSGVWPSVAAVCQTNYVDFALAARGSHLILVSCLDNLVKGASGQALQAFNASVGLDESLGLPAIGGAS